MIQENLDRALATIQQRRDQERRDQICDCVFVSAVLQELAAIKAFVRVFSQIQRGSMICLTSNRESKSDHKRTYLVTRTRRSIDM